MNARAECRSANAGRVAVIGGAYVAGEAVALAARHADWWTPPRQPFHFIWSGSPSKGQDGMLHGAIAYQVSQLAALGWDWACLSRTTSGWLGAITGIAVGLPKELGDGLHQNGFSGPDMLWTAAGALLPAFHRQFPRTAMVSLKVFYWPSPEYRNRTGKYPELENDYAGQRFYLSLNPARSNVASPWPAWLGLTVGHGVPAWVSQPPVHDWFVAMDFEFRGLPIRGRAWHRVATILDQLHCPFPGLRFRDGRVALGLF